MEINNDLRIHIRELQWAHRRTGAAAVFHLVMLRRGAIAHSSQGGNEVVEND